MAQELDLGHKLQPFVPYSLDHSTLYGASDPSYPGTQSEKGNPVAFDSAPRNQSQDDYPDGGLQAWLVVLGVRLPAYMSLWTATDHALGLLCLFFNVSSFRHTAY